MSLLQSQWGGGSWGFKYRRSGLKSQVLHHFSESEVRDRKAGWPWGNCLSSLRPGWLRLLCKSPAAGITVLLRSKAPSSETNLAQVLVTTARARIGRFRVSPVDPTKEATSMQALGIHWPTQEIRAGLGLPGYQPIRGTETSLAGGWDGRDGWLTEVSMIWSVY